MSRRQEIKDKEILQLKFQTSIRNNNDMIKKWLSPSGSGSADKSDNTNVILKINDNGTKLDQHKLFFNLPVVSAGKSLNSLKSEESIGSYLSGDAIKDNNKNVRTPMNSLMNKLKTKQRQNMHQKSTRLPKSTVQPKSKAKPQPKKSQQVQDSDLEDDRPTNNIKKPKLLF